jgi:hypothetical protein
MHEEWMKWLEGPHHDLTSGRQTKWPAISQVCEYVKIMWESVKQEMIVKSFKKCCNSPALWLKPWLGDPLRYKLKWIFRL